MGQGTRMYKEECFEPKSKSHPKAKEPKSLDLNFENFENLKKKRRDD
jgi:hypothetical protein